MPPNNALFKSSSTSGSDNVSISSSRKTDKAVGKSVNCGYIISIVSYPLQVDQLRISVFTAFCCKKLLDES